jgi:hypothetical protein
VDHCTFSNLYGQYGGGIDNYYGNVTVKNSTFSGDHAYYGGGIYNDEGKPRPPDAGRQADLDRLMRAVKSRARVNSMASWFFHKTISQSS